MKSFFIFFLWLITIVYTIVWTFENLEKIEKIKDRFKKNNQIEMLKLKCAENRFG